MFFNLTKPFDLILDFSLMAQVYILLYLKQGQQQYTGWILYL